MFEKCLYFNVNALARAVNRIWDKAFKDLGLSPAQAYLLRVVLAEPGASHKVIAHKLKLEKSTVTRFVDSLQGRGMLKRSKSGTKDGREHGVFPTEKAKRMEAALARKSNELYQKMCSNLGDVEIKSLVTRLQKAALKLA